MKQSIPQIIKERRKKISRKDLCFLGKHEYGEKVADMIVIGSMGINRLKLKCKHCNHIEIFQVG
jgi:hypothetical protein